MGNADDGMNVTIADIQRKVADAAFGRPLVTNVLRGHVAEAIIACALEPEWRWCAEDYSSWDFERADGLRLEVKQSAARQTWSTNNIPSPASFDIAERKGRWEGPVWVADPGRAAHVYVFAHHEVADESADHRDPAQWTFYVVRTRDLPPTRRLSLAAARRLSVRFRWETLASAVDLAVRELARQSTLS